MNGKKLFLVVGYVFTTALAGVQAYALHSKTGTITYSGFVFDVAVAVLCALGCFALLSRAGWAYGFVKGWNWILLVFSLLAVWLSPSPETRIPNLYLLGFATLVCSVF